MIWRLLGAGVFAVGVAAGAMIPASPPLEGDPPQGTRPPGTGPRSPAQPSAPLQHADERDELATLLQGVRGAGPITCGLALLALDGRGYGGPEVRADIEVSPGSPLSTRTLTRWAARPPRAPALVPPLRTALVDGDSCVRRTAARLLGRNGTDTAVAALVETLRTSDPLGRRSAALALGVAPDRASVPSLIAILGADEDPAPRKLAAWALGEIR